jgi:hypothetical protein
MPVLPDVAASRTAGQTATMRQPPGPGSVSRRPRRCSDGPLAPKDLAELGPQGRRGDELEGAGAKFDQERGARTARANQRRNKDVGVKPGCLPEPELIHGFEYIQPADRPAETPPSETVSLPLALIRFRSGGICTVERSVADDVRCSCSR